MVVFLYILNQVCKNSYPAGIIKWFMSCYFNDIVGSIGFIAYCNIILKKVSIYLYELWRIIFILFICGLFWEYVVPLFRVDSVSDPYDILAYMFGGFLYWIGVLIVKKSKNVV